MMDYRRVGIAYSSLRGENQLKSHFGIYKDYEGSLTSRYEGYSYQRTDGRYIVGLPLSGVNAIYMQPRVPFDRSHYEEVVFFPEKKEETYD